MAAGVESSIGKTVYRRLMCNFLLAGGEMAKPDLRGIRCEIGKLRDFIEDKESDPLERRLAQVAEDALRWATEDTDWAGPLADMKGMANIVRHDTACPSC